MHGARARRFLDGFSSVVHPVRMTRSRKNQIAVSCAAAAIAALMNVNSHCRAQSTTIAWVNIGDPGNPGDSSNGGSVGAVAYPYRIGKYEVTNAQYAAFLNAKAALGDPLGLFNAQMQSQPRGGIERTGNGTI